MGKARYKAYMRNCRICRYSVKIASESRSVTAGYPADVKDMAYESGEDVVGILGSDA